MNLWKLDTSLPDDLRQYANLIGTLPIRKYDGLTTTKLKPLIVYLTVREGAGSRGMQPAPSGRAHRAACVDRRRKILTVILGFQEISQRRKRAHPAGLEFGKLSERRRYSAANQK